MSRYVMIKGTLLFLFILTDFERSGADKNSPFSRSSKQNYRSQTYVRRPSVQRSNLAILFPTAAALGSLYIAQRMRPRIRPTSYHDLYDYTVCEGPKSEYVDRMGEIQTFPYFLCPDDPNQMFERYCCRDSKSGEGVCCSYDELQGLYRGISKWAILGGCIAILGILIMVALVVYCCCFAKRRQKPNAPPAQSPQTTEPVKSPIDPQVPQPIGFIPYPVGPPPPSGPQVPIYGPPTPYSFPQQPGAAWVTTPPLPGSSWQTQQVHHDIPPPPYPGTEQGSGDKAK